MRRQRNRPDTRPLFHIGLDGVIDRDELDQMAFHTDVITVSPGDVLARAGESARQFIAVIDGTVDVTHRSGRTQIGGPGTHIGGAELLGRQPHEADVVARTTCDVVVISRHGLASTLRHPAAAEWVQRHRPRFTEVPAAPTRELALVD